MAETLTLSARIRRHILDIDLTLPADHGLKSMIGGEAGAGGQDRPRGTVTVLFGPSGAGKTTLLRCLAGLERPDQGRITFGDETWDDARVHLPARRRRIGYLFQDHALFPHLSVAGNVGYGLRGVPRRERPARVAEALAAADAAQLADRSVRQLSGGEAQRVALARALARRPRLLLLDEPLSALDTPTRTRLQRELRRLLTAAAVPSIVVTHDRGEALALGDRMAVLIEGRLHQLDDLATVFGRPADPRVAAAVGVEAILPGELIAVTGGLARVTVGPHTLTAAGPAAPPGPVLACIRAEEVALEQPDQPAYPASQRNRLPATVREVSPTGAMLRVDLDCAGVPLTSYVTRLAGEELALAPGARVTAVVKTTAVHLVPRPARDRHWGRDG